MLTAMDCTGIAGSLPWWTDGRCLVLKRLVQTACHPQSMGLTTWPCVGFSKCAKLRHVTCIVWQYMGESVYF